MADVVGDIVRITLAFLYAAEQQVEEINVCWVCKASGGTDTRAALANAVWTAVESNYVTMLSTGTTGYGWRIGYLNRTPAPASLTGGTSYTGAGSGPLSVPTQARPLLSWLTAFSGRKYRGRLYMPSPQNSQIASSGFPATALVTAVGNVANALIPAQVLSGSTWQLVIAHRPAPGGAWTSTDVVSNKTLSKFATQRRSGNTGRTNAAPW